MEYVQRISGHLKKSQILQHQQAELYTVNASSTPLQSKGYVRTKLEVGTFLLLSVSLLERSPTLFW